MQYRTILIIDDHKDFREILRSFIEKNFKDINIEEAATGEEGVAAAIKMKPDISLIDIRLSGMDGIQASQLIKERVPECQVITMSMFKQSSLEDLIASKVITFVNKNEIDSELIPLLNRFLNGKKA